jgi:hypothetical protein
MGTRTTCDGTGVEIPADTPTTGHFGHQYCDDARGVATEYLAAVNQLHTDIAAMFQERLDLLRAQYRERLTQLPDDPP